MDFLLPPRMQTSSGNIRRVGFEIEFGGLSLEDAARLIIELYGGALNRNHAFSFEVKGTKFGDFSLESDSRFLSQQKYSSYLEKVGVPSESPVNENVVKILGKVAGTWIPFEVAMPPIPLTELQATEKIREKFFENAALGTSSSIFAAFGMQFNPEVPDFEVETLLSYLRSFFLLYDWLVEEADIAIARKLAPFIHPFSQSYMDFVLNPGYQPDLNRFMHDYLKENPTRNRPLDLLPLLAWINSDLVWNYPVERDLVKPRPTFHYRLPNSEIDDPHWSFAKEWNKWVEVEKLAYVPRKIREMTEDYFAVHGPGRLFPRAPWISRTREWMGNHVS